MSSARRIALSVVAPLSVVVAVATFVGAGVPVAAAQQDVLKIAERLNKKAMEDYDSLEFDSAKQTLQSAIAKLREAGQDETPTAARIYVNLGTVYFTADKDRTRAVNQFVEALKIDGTSQLDPERATPELQELFAEAQKRSGRGGGPKGKPGKPAKPPVAQPVPEPPPELPPVVDEPPPGSGVHGLQHNSVDEARAGNDVPIRAQMGADVNASRLFLFYRCGVEDYVSVPMTSKRGDWTGAIPGDAVSGKTCQYYIEARDSRNRPAVASGSAASPYIITITGGAHVDNDKPPGFDGEDPLRGKREGKRREREEAASTRGYGRMFFHLMAGTGIGVELAGNQYEVAYQYHSEIKGYSPLSVSQSGLAPAPLHGALELGVNINRHIALSLIGRLQGTLVNNADSSDDQSMKDFGGGTSKATTAFAGMLRFRYNFGEGRFKPGVHLGVGGGQIRHVLDISDANSPNPLVDQTTALYYQTSGPGGSTQDPYSLKPPVKLNPVCLDKNPCYDNIAIGYVLTSVGGSLYYDVSTWKNGGFGIILDVAAIFAFGGQFGINIDAQLGIGAHFL